MIPARNLTDQALEVNLALYRADAQSIGGISPEDRARFDELVVESARRRNEDTYVRKYEHVNAKGEVTVVAVDSDGDRWYGDNFEFFLPRLPNSVHGRYYAEQLAKLDEAGQQKFHDDFKLEGAYVPAAPAGELAYVTKAREIRIEVLKGRGLSWRPVGDQKLVAIPLEKLEGLIESAARIGLLTDNGVEL